MEQVSVREEYAHALRLGQKELRELSSAGQDPYPAVLDELLPELAAYSVRQLPVIDIPAERIVGTKSAGRVSAFTAGFLPLLDEGSEFAVKWMSLCEAHLSDTGIREPIDCYEYLGSFYVGEGNKRVSVLKYFGAAKIPGSVTRVLPPVSDEPRIKAYYEFLDFYRVSRLYDVQFRRPGDYARLLAYLGKEPGEEWTEDERRSFSSGYHYFREALSEISGRGVCPLPEEALLLWLKVYPASALGDMSPKELKKSLLGLWDDVLALSDGESVRLETAPESGSKGLLEKLISPAPAHLNVAMVHQRDAETSPWTFAHELGGKQLAEALGSQVTVRSYFHADTPERAEELLDSAVADGAELVFTTTPLLLRATLKAAVEHPKTRFFNCSSDAPFSGVRGYYCRAFEGKFITGAIAGAMADNNLIGYVGSYPIMGVPASVNAFALGALMTNPRAVIRLEWSCLPGDAETALAEGGVRVISNRDIPARERRCADGETLGVYLIAPDGERVPLASPCWLWGKLYENIVRGILSGKSRKKSPAEAVSYWWGMDSGAVDVEITDFVPESVRTLALQLMQDLKDGRLDPFRRVIHAQDGSLKNDGERSFSPAEVLHMDWLCANVEGRIPSYDELLPISRPLVRELGVYRDSIPPEKEGAF